MHSLHGCCIRTQFIKLLPTWQPEVIYRCRVSAFYRTATSGREIIGTHMGEPRENSTEGVPIGTVSLFVLRKAIAHFLCIQSGGLKLPAIALSKEPQKLMDTEYAKLAMTLHYTYREASYVWPHSDGKRDWGACMHGSFSYRTAL